MNFNSVEFLVFFPTVLLLYALVFRHERRRDLLLLAASYFFYMSWNWRYAGLILFSTTVDYFLGRKMSETEVQARRKRLMIVSITLNLGLLGFFKYNNFFVDSTGGLLTALGVNLPLDTLRHSFLLPVGISFYTFQSLSYTIDLYRKHIDVEHSFIKFALFVSFFPQLVAGPIVRAADFLPQLRTTPNVDRERVLSGMALIFRGLFKKVVFADLLAGLGVDTVFASPSDYSSLTLLLALYGYSFQIYNDFSGYSDVAIGAARIMGFDLPDNFRRPYHSQNVREFWTRWHISLSSWLRDYLYIPLGGSRASAGRVRFNLAATMVLGGLWHGAAWNFVLWGAWHGFLLMLVRSAPKSYDGASPWAVFGRQFLCFHLVVVSWLLFRVHSIPLLTEFLGGLGAMTLSLELTWPYLLILAGAAGTHFTKKQWIDSAIATFTRTPIVIQAVVYAGLICLLAGLSFGGPAFIYFQF
ncbi:MAG: MBOAT family O-acyltransferase [Gemmatimonadota bacterium]